jgi:hypothetical protein
MSGTNSIFQNLKASANPNVKKPVSAAPKPAPKRKVSESSYYSSYYSSSDEKPPKKKAASMAGGATNPAVSAVYKPTASRPVSAPNATKTAVASTSTKTAVAPTATKTTVVPTATKPAVAKKRAPSVSSYYSSYGSENSESSGASSEDTDDSEIVVKDKKKLKEALKPDINLKKLKAAELEKLAMKEAQDFLSKSKPSGSAPGFGNGRYPGRQRKRVEDPFSKMVSEALIKDVKMEKVDANGKKVPTTAEEREREMEENNRALRGELDSTDATPVPSEDEDDSTFDEKHAAAEEESTTVGSEEVDSSETDFSSDEDEEDYSEDDNDDSDE